MEDTAGQKKFVKSGQFQRFSCSPESGKVLFRLVLAT